MNAAVGFDLDMTLIDSRPGIRAAYRALTERTGVYVDADLAVTRLGYAGAIALAALFPVLAAPLVPVREERELR